MNNKLFASLLGALLLGTFLARPAQALTLIPPNLEFSLQSGETIETKVKLFNETADSVTQYSSTANFTAKDETGTPAFLDEAVATNLASWITLEPGPFTLLPGERLEIHVTVAVPADAEPGGHYAAIFFSSLSPDTAGTGEVGISTKLGSLVLVRVAGAIREAGSIATFGSKDGATMFTRPPVDFLLRVANSGNVHIRPTGDITIRNSIGGTTATVPVNVTQGAVLPSSTRAFNLSWEKSANDTERENFFQEVAAEWRNFAFGPYTATVDLSYGAANDKTATAKLSYWILPWQLLIVTVVGLVALIWLLIWLVGVYNRAIISKATKSGKK